MSLQEYLADGLISFVDAYYFPDGEKQLEEFIKDLIDQWHAQEQK